VAQVGKLEFGGFIAWLAWLVLHLYYLVGHKNRVTAVLAWLVSFLGRGRGQMAITSQMIYARQALSKADDRAQGALAAADEAEEAEQKAG
jgi:NADH dehydrogenase